MRSPFNFISFLYNFSLPIKKTGRPLVSYAATGERLLSGKLNNMGDSLAEGCNL